MKRLNNITFEFGRALELVPSEISRACLVKKKIG